MMGLVAYGSDSEDGEQEAQQEVVEPTVSAKKPAGEATISLKPTIEEPKDSPTPTNGKNIAIVRSYSDSPAQAPDDTAPILGPSRPPASPSPAASPYSEAPLSPYSHNRATIRSLTLPTSIPDIPSSPPGPESSAVAQKFEHFRVLKKQGIHFNEKLARSSALRNPNLLDKLTAFVGVTNQYVSNLPKEVWDPMGFPEEANFEKLAKSQSEILAARQAKAAAEERAKIEFVASGITQESGKGSGGGGGRSAAERIMAGLDRERKSTPPGGEGSRRRGDGKDDRSALGKDRESRWDDKKDRRRDDDWHRKRRRSRSRSRSKSRERDRYRDYNNSRR